MMVVIEPLRNLFSDATEYIKKQDIVLTDRFLEGTTWWYYFIVGDHNVVIKVFREENKGPYRKEFSCDCTHNSLFGREDNIPCKHIIAVLLYLGMGELFNGENI